MRLGGLQDVGVAGLRFLRMPPGHGHVAQLHVDVQGYVGQRAVADGLAHLFDERKRRIELRPAALTEIQPENKANPRVRVQVVVLHDLAGAGSR